MSAWQAVIFDLDDTLFPERDYVLSGFRAVAAWAEGHVGIPAAQGFAALQGLFAEGVRGNVFDRWLAGHEGAALLVPRLVQVYREHQPLLTPFEGVRELLAFLRGRSRLGVVSDGYLAVQQGKFAALGLGESFDAVVFSDAWGREAWKPSTRPFEEVLRRLPAEAGEAVYVADNPAKDFLGARRLGMFTIRLRQDGGEYAHLDPPSAEHAPHRTVTSLAELRHLLGG